MSDKNLLSDNQIQTYLHDGILVVPLLSPAELLEAQIGLIETLSYKYGVDVNNLEGTGKGLIDASSTNGAGGVLDVFYPKWKMKISTNEKLFRMTCQLWREAYCHNGECFEEMCSKDGRDESFKWHPFGAFDCDQGYIYIDRIGFRIPTDLATKIGNEVTKQSANENAPKKSSRSRPIQRSLTPHFDCCPETYDDAINKNKWRPIQCFVSLTDNMHPNTGGFEAVPGFHREFREWTKNGRRLTDEDGGQHHPRPCVGEYTHINPTHDREILDRIQHISVKAGCAVFWDNRIAHGNSYRNDPLDYNNATRRNDVLTASGARAVVYCSFLPAVEINRDFVMRQLTDFNLGRAPKVGDRWISNVSPSITSNITDSALETEPTVLARKLLGLAEW